MSYKLDRSKLPCIFSQTTWEDVVGDGGPRMEMWDCVCNKSFTTEEQEKFENVTVCTSKCPGYSPCEIFYCKKHDVETIDNLCDECMLEEYKRDNENGAY